VPVSDNPFLQIDHLQIDSSPPRSLAQSAYESLRDMLVTVRIRPGAPLSEEQLTRHLGMGRTPVREAIKRLEAERLVVIYPRRGGLRHRYPPRPSRAAH
jgi:DNA-binding GntR family transcriptional regulator